MAVSLSPFAGAGWQFFTDNGVPLTGGKLYVYLAGTTSPATTYTNSTGATANTNPIILNSAGRLANEIWLTVGLNYKFILKTSVDTQIGSWDNIPAGTTDVADLQAALASSTGAGMIGYIQGGVGSVATTVQEKLRETVSVFDFMTATQIADVQAGTASIDVTIAITNALNNTSGSIYFPSGEYKITSTLTVPKGVSIYGSSYENVIINAYSLVDSDAVFYLTGGDQFSTIDNIQFKGQASGSKSIGIKVTNGYSVSYTNLRFTNMSYGLLLDEAGSCLIQNCTFTNCLFGAKCTGGSGYTFAFNNFNYGTSTGIQVDDSPTTGFPTGIIVSQCLFTSNVGIRVPLAAGAYGGHNFVVDQCYFEGDAGVGTICQPFIVGNEGTGSSISCATITNCRMAQSSSTSSIYKYIDTLFFAGNVVGTNVTFPTSILQLTLSNNIFVGTLTNGATKTININDISNYIFKTDRLTPTIDSTQFLGDGSHRWDTVYTVNGMTLGTNILITSGAGSPESVISAPVGSLYLRTDGSTTTTLYVKTSGTGNTGWTAK
jgi:hypothetical protein